MWEAATNMEKVLDAQPDKVGFQLPDKFEDTFKDFNNKNTLVKEAGDQFKNMDPTNRTTIINKAATEITWWTKMPEKWEKDYSQRIAVLYLYTALNTGNKNPTPKDVQKTFTDIKTEAAKSAPAAKEATPDVLKDKKTAAIAALNVLYTTEDGYDTTTLTALNNTKIEGTTKINAATADAEITTAQTNATKAINALQVDALTDAQTAATGKLSTFMDGLRAEDYTTENWTNIQKEKTTGKDAILDTKANKTPALVVAAETKAETTISAIPTKEAIKTQVDQQITQLKEIDLTGLPKSVQRKINRIMKMNDKDEKVDQQIEDIKKEMTETLANIDSNKGNNRVLYWSNEKPETAEEIQNMGWLFWDLKAQKAELTRLTDKAAKLADRMTKKMEDISEILGDEIQETQKKSPRDETIAVLAAKKAQVDALIATQKSLTAKTDVAPVTKTDVAPATKNKPAPAKNKPAPAPTAEEIATKAATEKASYQEKLKNMDAHLRTGLPSLRSSYKEGDNDITIQRITWNIIKKDGDKIFSKYVETNWWSWENISMFWVDGLYTKVAAFDTNSARILSGQPLIEDNNIANNNRNQTYISPQF